MKVEQVANGDYYGKSKKAELGTVTTIIWDY